MFHKANKCAPLMSSGVRGRLEIASLPNWVFTKRWLKMCVWLPEREESHPTGWAL